MSSFEEQRQSMIKDGEGCIPYMYLDTVGRVTVAVGQMLPTAAAAQGLMFTRRDDGNRATAAEINQDYQAVAQQPPGRVASFYKQFTRLDMPEDAIDALLDTRIDEFEAGLRRDFPGYDSYPDEAKLGLMDMVFNLGNSGLIRGFPTFTRAARGKDWRTCANQCRRRGISDARNAMTKKLFEDAATAAGQ
jgi:GH24 family phage-related lysozyme (muramidase)